MGFWHTGYMEFHEATGLGHTYTPEKPVYACKHCEQRFDSMDALRRHRFEAHPYKRPVLFVRGIELGTTPFRLTRSASPSDFVLERCADAFVNGERLPPKDVPARLASVNNDRVKVELGNGGASAVFELDISIAQGHDLEGIEAAFLELAKKKELTRKSVEAFIEACEPFATAQAYYDSICKYLYGVMAKEKDAGTSLPYEAYLDRFNQAADALQDYDRPLARMVRALIAFHFNHFSDAAAVAPPGRLQMASERFVAALDSATWDEAARGYERSRSVPEDLLTDFETLRILRWSEMSAKELAGEIKNISALIKRDELEYDRLKLTILLAEASAAAGDTALARRTARELIGTPQTAAWAERMIARQGA